MFYFPRGGRFQGSSSSESGRAAFAHWIGVCVFRGFHRLVKLEKLHASVEVLDHGRAAFNPIATVVVGRAVDFADRSGMDVAAEHTVHIVILRIAHDGLLEFPNEADDIFDLGFDIGAERPVAKAGEAADEINDSIAAHEQDIADVAQVSEPAHVLHNGIEFVSVHDEQSAAVRRFVNGVFLKRHARIMPVEGGEEFVVIADDVDDFRSLPAFAQKFLNDVVVLLRPVNATAKGPNVDEVADKVEGVKLHILQKIEEDAGFAPTRAEMNVRNPTSAIARCHAGGDLSAGGADD